MPNVYYIIVGYIIYWLLIVIHEMGHLFASVLLGYGWREVKAGPIAIVLRGKEHHLIYSKGWFYGKVVPVLNRRPYNTKRLAIFYAAGPLANLYASIVLFLIFSLLTPVKRDAYWPISLGAAASFYLFMRSLIPIEIKRLGLKSDGLNLLNRWRHRSKSR